MPNYLFLVRHGESEWNEKGLWTGWVDTNLTEKGKDEARRAAKVIGEKIIHHVHVSPLLRAKQTMQEILNEIDQQPPVAIHGSLLERDYGDYTGKNKWQIKEEIGDEQFTALRRGWDVHVPGGETLKMVHDRVVPYFESAIMPQLREGKNVLVTAHGNTLRALMKHLDHVPDNEVHDLEIATGEIVAYKMTEGELVREK